MCSQAGEPGRLETGICRMSEYNQVFTEQVVAVYQHELINHAGCDVFWKYGDQPVQLLTLAPWLFDELMFVALGWTGEYVARFVLHGEWVCWIEVSNGEI